MIFVVPLRGRHADLHESLQGANSQFPPERDYTKAAMFKTAAARAPWQRQPATAARPE